MPAVRESTDCEQRSYEHAVQYLGFTQRWLSALAISLLVWIVAVTAFDPASVRAQDGSREAALILRILSYDRNLAARANTRVPILVVYRQGDSASEAEQRRIFAAINDLGARITVANMRAGAVPHAYQDARELANAARASGAVAIYVCAGLGNETAAISGVARQAHTLSMSSDPASVRRGLGVGLVWSAGTMRLIVNLPAVEAEGARLDPAVLRLAEVIR